MNFFDNQEYFLSQEQKLSWVEIIFCPDSFIID